MQRIPEGMANTVCFSGHLENCKHLHLSGVSQRKENTLLYLDTIRSKLKRLWANFTIKFRLISVYQTNKHSWPLRYLCHLSPFHPCILLEPKRPEDEREWLHFGLLFSESFFSFPCIILRISWGQITVAEKRAPLWQQQRAIEAALTAPTFLHFCIFDGLIFVVDGVLRLNGMCSNRCQWSHSELDIFSI